MHSEKAKLRSFLPKLCFPGDAGRSGCRKSPE